MALSTNLVAGLSSGFDWRSMIDQLMKIEHRRVDLVGNRKTDDQKKLTEWQSFNTKLLSLKTAASALSDPESFDLHRSTLSSDNASVTASDLLSVTTSSSAAKGSYTIVVEALATAERLRSKSFGGNSEALGLSGDLEINEVVINVSESDTLASIRTKINNAGAGVTASLVSYGEEDHRLTLTSDTTGKEGIALGGAAEILAALDFTVIAAGSDATVVIDGISLTKSTNVIEGVLEGVTLNLLKADSGTTLTLKVDRDVDGVMNKIKSFVDAYNSVSAYLKQQQSYDAESQKTGGVLFGDGTLSSVKSDLTSLLTQQVWGVSSELSTLGLAGIEVDKEGRLSLNEAKLRGYLETRFNDIKLLFPVNGATDSGSLGFIYSSRNTQAGEYAVHITEAATQSGATSDKTVPGALGYDETLTITLDGKTATIVLTAGMMLQEIVQAVNDATSAELIDVKASRDESDRLVLSRNSYGSRYGFKITEDRDDGLWENSHSTPIEVNNGLDVAGTINGEAATGSGQILTGNSGEANVEGLAVRYTGTATGEVGKITLTLGVAELFDRALFNITDPYAGYVSFKQESLRNSIRGFETRIEEMEAQLNKKMEMMINRFVAMETALSRIQSQSQWLAGQITASYSGWARL